MLTWIIQISLISIIFIFLVHHLLMFFKSTLTVPKIKDLVNSPNQKYKNIYETLSNNTYSNDYTDIDLLPRDDFENNEQNTMKNELKTFLKKKLNNESDNIIGLDSDTYTNFSNF